MTAFGPPPGEEAGDNRTEQTVAHADVVKPALLLYLGAVATGLMSVAISLLALAMSATLSDEGEQHHGHE